jgi:GH25 family lysozyme M1 (1,4-beta-N-acetylmuramidase)
MRLAASVGAVGLVAAVAVPVLAVGGVDVSSWNHPSGRSIHWSQVKAAGKSFVFIKATEGTRYTNGYFAGDWRGSGRAGLIRGAYHFAQPSSRTLSAAAQARHFVRVVGSRLSRPSLPPVLDLEVTNGLGARKIVRWTRTWLATVKSLTGRVPMIYTYLAYWRQYFKRSTALRAYPLWIACYCSRPAAGSWPRWTFWQFIDLDKFSGTVARLKRLAGFPSPSPSPSPTASPTPSPTVSPTASPTISPTPSGAPT